MYRSRHLEFFHKKAAMKPSKNPKENTCNLSQKDSNAGAIS